MQAAYHTSFPNQVHQLNVSLSQHYFLLKDGSIKWQEKKLDINWKNHHKVRGTALATYIVRDHFSSCYYAELHPADALPEIEDFLYNAWSKKSDYEFFGIGHEVIVPGNTLEQFPKLKSFFQNIKNIPLQVPTSGFSSAVRSIRDWENSVKFVITWFEGSAKITGFQAQISKINRLINSHYHPPENGNLRKWLTGGPKIIDIPERSIFRQFFQPLNP